MCFYFGDLKTIEKCKYGDEVLNISATEFRNNIAKQNGWRHDLDTNIAFYKQIDDIYNPNILEEKARNFYSIAKLRRDLCTDNVDKLSVINDICNANKDKKILIVSKRGEFAAQITKFLMIIIKICLLMVLFIKFVVIIMIVLLIVLLLMMKVILFMLSLALIKDNLECSNRKPNRRLMRSDLTMGILVYYLSNNRPM